MDNKIVKISITITLAVILLGAVLVPVLSQSFKDEITEQNAGTKFFEFAQAATVSITADSDGVTYTVNDVAIDVPDFTRLVVCSDLFVLHTTESVLIVYDKSDLSRSGVTSGTIDFEITNGQYTIDINGTSRTGSVDGAYYYSGSVGEYVEAQTFTANRNTHVIGSVGDGLWLEYSGIIDIVPSAGSATVTIEKWTDDSPTTANVNMSWDCVDNGNGTYDITDITTDPSVSMVNLIVPVDYIKTVDSSYTSLVMVIPIMIIVALIACVARIIKD